MPNAGAVRIYECRRPDGTVLDRCVVAPSAIIRPDYPLEADVGWVQGPYDVWVSIAGGEFVMCVPDAENLAHVYLPYARDLRE